MTIKQLNSQIIKGIRSGASKSELYEEFKEEVDLETLRKALASQPSLELRNYFKFYHRLVSFIVGFFILFELLGLYEFFIDFRIEPLISVAISFYIAVKIWSFSGPFFLSGVIWLLSAIVMTFFDLSAIAYDSTYDGVRIVMVIYSCVIFIGVVMMWMLHKHAFTYYHCFQPKRDSENCSRYE
ncbi:MAG: hypothetical protein ACJAUD_000046 [Crocinitomicaceae bacterium]|jgi:hypothetical protein